MHDMLNFCTLFDSNYIDRALVMYQSLEAVLDDFKLYVIAFDLKCEQIEVPGSIFGHALDLALSMCWIIISFLPAHI